MKWGWFIIGLTTLASVSFWLALKPSNALPVSTVYISELAWAGSSLSANDEWIELANPTDDSVDIGGWVITKNTGTESLMLTIPAPAQIQPHGFFVISNFSHDSSVLGVVPDLVDPAITLSNSTLQIKLYKGDFSVEENLVDIAGDGGVPPAGDNNLKLSMERDDDGWHSAGVATNLDDGVIDKATPLAPNSELVLPPALISISPAMVEAGSTLYITSVNGDNFATDGEVVLKLTKQDSEILASGVHIASTSLIDAGEFVLPLDGQGSWSLQLINPDGLSAILPEAITVTSPPPEEDPPLEEPTIDIVLNELCPHPTSGSSAEFIEILNRGDTEVDLNGWKVDDIANGGSAPFTFATLIIPPQGLVVAYQNETKITLNDTGDSVRLIRPDGEVADSTVYPDAPLGWSWVRNQADWQWTTTPTPAQLNVFTENEEEEEATEDPKPKKYTKGDLEVTELLPNPQEGDEEFIEIYNPTKNSIPLADWRIRDESGNSYRFSGNTKIGRDEWLVIYKQVSGIQLNDTKGEVVELIDPSGKIISVLAYPDSAPEGVALIRIEEGATWVKPASPGKANPTDLVEIETEVSSYGEAVAGDSLPVTGWGSLSQIFFIMMTGLGMVIIWSRKLS